MLLLFCTCCLAEMRARETSEEVWMEGEEFAQGLWHGGVG